MIRDLNKRDTIEYSKSFINDSHLDFIKLWFFNPAGMLEDMDFYATNNWCDFTLRTKIFGVICGLFMLSFCLLTFILLYITAMVTGHSITKPFFGYDSNIVKIIGRGIILLFLLIPFSLIKFPFSLYSYFAFKKQALFNLLKVNPDDPSSEK